MSRFVKALLISVFLIPLTANAGGKHMALFSIKGDFDNVKQLVVDSIQGHGLVINNISHIGTMLERTGKDLGATKQVYIKADALEFCSATVSRNMMEADPDNIIFCPYIIFIYVRPDKPDTVFVAYRKPLLVGSPESKQSLKAVDNLLHDIISEALF